jgi:hypothetical protein
MATPHVGGRLPRNLGLIVSIELPPASVVVNPIALAKPQAAAVLGMSVDSFDRYVGPHVRCVRRGRLRLYPVRELERWATENAERIFDDAA